VLAEETVEGFNVFKSSKKAEAPLVVNEGNDQAENEPAKQNKELNRKLEVSSYFFIFILFYVTCAYSFFW
jgi:hypothetical protein